MSPRTLVVLATCMLTTVACAPAGQDSSEAATSQEESAAAYQEQLVEGGWAEAFNAGDAQRIAAFYTEDAVRIPPDEAPIQGREAIRRNFQETFDGFSSHQIRSSPPAEIHASGDWIMARGTWTLEGTPAESGAAFDQAGNYVVVSRRGADGQWKLHWEMWSIH